MKAFWRAEPLNAGEAALLAAVLAAHKASAGRMNESTRAMVAGAQSSGDYGKALASAILTLGGVHGPIEAAMRLLTHGRGGELGAQGVIWRVGEILVRGGKVPGWGNSFYKGTPDPLWAGVDSLLAETIYGPILSEVTLALWERGKHLYPNPAAFTAATALLLGVPACVAPFLFVAGRLAAWSQQYLENYQTLWEL
jgi:citrate synthase